MKRDPPQAKSTAKQKSANQDDPKISKDTGELPDSELNKATGGITVSKPLDQASVHLLKEALSKDPGP